MSYARNKRKKMKSRMRKFGLSRDEAYAVLSWSQALQQLPKRRP